MTVETLRQKIDVITAAIHSGEIEKSSRAELVQFNTALCNAASASYFSGNYAETCETVRFHLLRVMVEDLERRNSFIQCLVIFLAVMSVAIAIPQIYFADKADTREEIREEKEKTERAERKSIASVPIPVKPQAKNQAESQAVGAGKTKKNP